MPTNATMGLREAKVFRHLAAEGENLLRADIREYGLSARTYGRILKVAHTIANLAESSDIGTDHFLKAVQSRRADIWGRSESALFTT